MSNFVLPAPGSQRPTTAMGGVGDLHDDNIYSAVVAAHGAVGTAKAFLAGQGSQIPQVPGTTAIVAANVPTTYVNYTPLTTIIEQAGQLGATIGDATVRALGVTFDLTAYAFASGLPRVWGATAFEVADLLSKTRLEIKVSAKRRIGGPTWSFPNVGGNGGNMATTANAATLGAIQNGQLPTGKRLKAPIEVSRNDVLLAEFSADAALAFSDTSFATTHTGQATLIWINLVSSVRGDVR